MIDTHAHLHFPQYDKDRDKIIEECNQKLDAVVTVGCNFEDSKKALALADSNYKIYGTAGIHPHDAVNYDLNIKESLKNLLQHEKTVAVGEAGLDFYRNLSPKEKQEEIFRLQIELAREFEKPIVIHTREASTEMSEFIKTEMEGVKGIIHCFNGDKELLETALKHGFFISYAGPVTYPKNEFLRETLKNVPSSRLLVETDAPYLSPQKFRGKRNHPVYVAYTIKTIAEYLGLNFSDVDRITTVNAKRIFNLPMTKEEKSPKLVYKVRNTLYINLTTKCPCHCTFCFRGKEDYVLGYNLNLDREPIAEEYMYRIKNPGIYDELVFCGYGEPFERFDALCKIAEWIKKMGAKKVRVNTNGLGYLITNDKKILDKLKGLVDSFNISINASTPEEYYKIVRPSFGKGSFESVLKFIQDAKKAGFEVVISAVDIEDFDKNAFIQFAKKLGVNWKIRNWKVI
ncbi:TatD family hydrolase [Desulfurobacterium atlanticum]|uniref:TatD DNase family protein n=1 Tax=Desulfurobacterium atlanticum TaxID=240169 RepID=A0A239A101_9BACT|nr:TatD family hydrolase [Desulfurobacterium atlanticum]SNR89179.1 TatD DNase family protein [Desulfurobacterium atlanticum]